MFRYFHESRTAWHVSQLFFNYDGDVDVMHVYTYKHVPTLYIIPIYAEWIMYGP